MKSAARIVISFIYIVGLCVLTACSSNASRPTEAVTAHAGLYSNTVLSPSDTKANAYLPLNKTLVANIRAVGGEVYQSGNFITIVIPSDALFEPGTAVVLSHADQLMTDVAKIIVRFPGENVIITAHTDNIGSPYSQAKLTRQQAQLFATILWQQDEIDLKTFQRFKYAGMGNTQSITDDSSPNGQFFNRRIQVTIYPTSDMEAAYQRLGNHDLHPG